MHLNDYFKQFLSNIEPTRAQVGAASTSHNAVRKHLANDEKFKDIFVDSFLAGSYARDTAVKPIRDVDIIVVTRWDKEPAALLKELKAALDRSSHYKTKTSPQRRSICVELEHISMDIVPAREVLGLAQLQVPDREQKEWVDTNPRGHTDWVIEINKQTKKSDADQGRFVPLAKMAKHWKRFRLEQAKHPKGFWIESLCGWNHDPDARDWADVFIRSLELITGRYAADSTASRAPQLTDPGLIHRTLSTGLTGDEFQVFFSQMEKALAAARTARDDQTSHARSAELWREVFGPKFPSKEQREAQLRIEASALASRGSSLGARSGRDISEPEPFGGDVQGRPTQPTPFQGR
jgi:hypothetical protein